MVNTAHTEACTRCAGSGHFSFNLIDGTKCYGCNGSGKKTFKTSPEVRAAAKARRDAKRAAVNKDREIKARAADAPIKALQGSLINDPRCTPFEVELLTEGGAYSYEMARAVLGGWWRPWVSRGVLTPCEGFNWYGDAPNTKAINADVLFICEELGHCWGDEFLLSLLNRLESGRELTSNQRRALARR